MGSRWMRNSFIYLLLIVALVAIVFTFFSGSLGGSNELSINEVITMASRGQVQGIEVKGDSLTVTTFSGETFESRKEAGSSVVEMLRDAQVDLSRVNVTVKGSGGLSAIFGLLFNFLPLIFFGRSAPVHDETGAGQFQPDLQLRKKQSPHVHGQRSAGQLL